VNDYAKALKVGIAFIREGERRNDEIEFHSDPRDVIGDVAGKHVLIYDDIIRSGKTIIAAADMYLAKGATGVDVVTSHLACFEDDQIIALKESRIGVIIATNSHPVTQNPLVSQDPKFQIVEVMPVFFTTIAETLPSKEHRYRFSY
jgi:ribose-phosphate pyrophosphokinase